MDEQQHHEELVSGIYNQQKEIFESSEQAVFAYLDDNHKVCNDNFAKLLGYGTAEELLKTQGSFLEMFVAPDSRDLLADTYQMAMEKMVGSTIKVTLQNKSGEAVETTMILVPIMYNGHLFALHFLS